MFGLGGLGLGSKIAIGMGVLLLATMAASAWYFKYSQGVIQEQAQEVAAQKARAASAEANLDAMRDDVAEQSRELRRLANEMAENRKAAQNLEDTFAEHDLNALVNAKPNLVQRRVNDGTARTLSRIEEITDPRSYDDVDQFVVPEEEKDE
jgi:F0F1-type ATP synthase membrane subunit b/b'